MEISRRELRDFLPGWRWSLMLHAAHPSFYCIAWRRATAGGRCPRPSSGIRCMRAAASLALGSTHLARKCAGIHLDSCLPLPRHVTISSLCLCAGAGQDLLTRHKHVVAQYLQDHYAEVGAAGARGGHQLTTWEEARISVAILNCPGHRFNPGGFMI